MKNAYGFFLINITFLFTQAVLPVCICA